jgi:hypothetical protein
MALPEREPGRAPELNLSDTKSEAVLFNGKLSGLELPWSSSKQELMAGDIFTAPKRRLKAIKDFSAARQIAKPIENYAHRVAQRVHSEGWTAALTTDATSIFVLPGAQALIALNLHTGMDMTDPKLAVAAALTGISLITDWYALRKKGWDISIVGCIAQAISGRPSLSAIVEHAINYIGPFNLVNIGAFAAGIATGKFSFLADNIVAAPFVLAPWYIVMNTLIGHGQADKVLNPIKRAEDATWGRIKQAIKR